MQWQSEIRITDELMHVHKQSALPTQTNAEELANQFADFFSGENKKNSMTHLITHQSLLVMTRHSSTLH